jgi:Spherulation-specific family 4
MPTRSRRTASLVFLVAIAVIPRQLEPPATADETPASTPGSTTNDATQRPVKEGLNPAATRRRLNEARVRILIPAYFYPGGKTLDDWQRMIDASTRVPIIAVMNIESGPGRDRNPEYAAILDRAIDHGVTVVGYVHTRYGARPASEVESEIDRWLKYYPPIQGIFFDAQAGPAGFEAYYESLAAYARRKICDALIINNPGTTCAPTYLERKISSATCVIESADSLENYRLPLTAGRFTSNRFAALCFGVVKVDAMRSYIEKLPELRLGYVFITDQQLPNPWHGLPEYWEAEVDAVRRVNLRQSVLP